MTDARWCNYGDHAFDGSRGDTIIIGKMEQVTNQWGGQQPHFTPNLKEMCGECAATLGLIEDYKAPEAPATRHDVIVKELRDK